ncbi:glycosyltransferase family 2 protein [Candidatus Methylacidithermus pantelleriae]|uniref:Glycosyltransferase n=1 Tax=Candidatus Methylacidithermus pantelleriae TaxID=2744239 RepID=A0A8J2FSB2_9BACT|nr:glycosyltransferase family 2 protein [Candidatus Methylacidithermus pantelleriae]CAF0697545.1 Glycosyltransferase [Candidatus Methylacidithermus pantelleriae]
MEPLPISVTMIACNEAHNLPRSLGSVAGWVREIIVVINDCTDLTAEVALSLGARVEERPWTCRRDQKNVALSLATQPWILALDADEEVSAELRKDIFLFFQEDHLHWDGAEFPRRTWFLNRWILHGDWYPDYSLRLFRKDRGTWGGSSEHDRVLLDGRIKRLRGDLLHYSFPTVTANLSKIVTFAEAFGREKLQEGKQWSLAETLFRTFWRFFRSYILRLGFLDGYPGFYIAWMTAVATLVRYSKLYELQRARAPEKTE